MKRLFVLAVAVSLPCSAMADYSWYDDWRAENPNMVNYADNRFYDSSVRVSGLWNDNGCAFLINGTPKDIDQQVVGGNSTGYIEICLGLAGADVSNVILFLRTNSGYVSCANGYTVLVSTTGNADGDFTPVANPSGPRFFFSDKFHDQTLSMGYYDENNLSTHRYYQDGIAYDFDPVPGATYVRIAGVQGLAYGWFATGVAVHGAVPEPATMSLLALGGLALLRRRRK